MGNILERNTAVMAPWEIFRKWIFFSIRWFFITKKFSLGIRRKTRKKSFLSSENFVENFRVFRTFVFHYRTVTFFTSFLNTEKYVKQWIFTVFLFSIPYPNFPKQNMLDVYRESKSKHRLRGIGIFLLSRRKMFSHFPDLLVFPHWHSDTIMLVLGLWWDFYSSSLSHTCKLSVGSRLSRRKRWGSHVDGKDCEWNAAENEEWEIFEQMENWQFYCNVLYRNSSGGGKFSYANWKTRWKLIFVSIFTLSGESSSRVMLKVFEARRKL